MGNQSFELSAAKKARRIEPQRGPQSIQYKDSIARNSRTARIAVDVSMVHSSGVIMRKMIAQT
jgi:hypothetical protein